MSILEDTVDGLPLDQPDRLRALRTVLSDDTLRWLVQRAEVEREWWEAEQARRQRA